MRRTLIVVLMLLVAVPLFGEDHSAKKALVAELLKTIDTKALTQAFFNMMLKAMTGTEEMDVAALTPEQRTEFETAQNKRQATSRS